MKRDGEEKMVGKSFGVDGGGKEGDKWEEEREGGEGGNKGE